MIQSITAFIIQLFGLFTRTVNMVDNLVQASEHQTTNLNELSEGHLKLSRLEREELLEQRVDAVNKARSKRGKEEVNAADIMRELQDAAGN